MQGQGQGHDMSIVLVEFQEEAFLGREFRSMLKKSTVNSQ